MNRNVLTKDLFSNDSYLKEFPAKIIEVDEDAGAVVLNQTAFFPGGGGQPFDTGYLLGGAISYEVVKTKRQGNRIFHYLKDDLPDLESEIQGVISWERRYQLMRTHSALHVMCGVIWRDYGAQVTGGNMEPLRGRLDFEFESLTAELAADIETKVNKEIEVARAVSVKVLPREEAFQIPDLIRTKVNLLPDSLKEVRIVTIEGLDLQADGGTHVANIQEIGPVKILKYKSKGKINKRIEIGLTP